MELNRRQFLASLVVGFAWPLFAKAQARRPLIAFLGSTTVEASQSFNALVEALRGLGDVDGATVTIVSRFSDGYNDRLAALVQELIALNPDVLAVETGAAVLAASQLTKAIPIVMAAGAAEAISQVAGPNFSRPSGNVTGYVTNTAAVVGKQIEIAHELVPSASTIGLLDFTLLSIRAESNREADFAAHALGVNLLRIEVSAPADLEPAFKSFASKNVAIVVAPQASLFSSEASRLIALEATTGIPVIFGGRSIFLGGGLASYSIDVSAGQTRVADLVHHILRGSKVADLPIEIGEPALLLNLKTAKSLGLTIPPSVLVRADEVIE